MQFQFFEIIGDLPDIKMPAGFVARCYLAALPTASLAFFTSRWDSLPALSLFLAVGAVLLFAGFSLLKVVGEREKELILKLPLPFKEKLVSIL